MRWSLVLLLLLLLLVVLMLRSSVLADPPSPAAPKPPNEPPSGTPAPAPAAPAGKPLTPEQAADAAIAAVQAKGDAALQALAAKDDPDPWLVADELIRRNERDVAEAFAKAAPRVNVEKLDVEKLPAYVSSRRGKPDDAARRARLAAANEGLEAQKPNEALEALGARESASVEDVLGVRLGMARGMALLGALSFQEAVMEFLVGAETSERMGWLARAARAYDGAGKAALRGAAYAVARSAFERGLSLCERRSDPAGAARMLLNVGAAVQSMGDQREALATFERALAAMEALGERAGAAVALSNIGNVQFAMGDYAKALVTGQRALAAREALGDKAGAAKTLRNVGNAERALGDIARARETLERALAAQEALGDRAAAAHALSDLATVFDLLGDHPAALARYQRALAVQETLKDVAAAATTLGNIGLVYDGQGDYAEALSTYERALAAKEALGDRAGAASTLGNMGLVRFALGDHGKALASYRLALSGMEALGDKAGTAKMLGNIGLVEEALEDHAQALATYRLALAAKEAIGDKAGAARTLGNIGLVEEALGDHARARETLRQALAIQEAIGESTGAARTLANIALVEDALGDSAAALASYERAITAQEALGDKADLARTLGRIGVVYARLGAPRRALAYEHRAARVASSLARGLGAEEGAGARESLTFIFDAGARAAVAAHDAAELAFFLESGRAGALLEGLAARETLWSTMVPEDLRVEETNAQITEAAATRALRLALGAGDLAVLRARKVELAAARERVSAVIARIQRLAKSGAALAYPKAATLAEMQATLVDGDVLLLYAILEGEAFALVVAKADARIVLLGPSVAIEAAVAALALGDVAADPTDLIARLETLVVEPLRLLPSTRRVLVSPSGALSYLPFAALLSDVAVSSVPSGTTYQLLLDEGAKRGAGVLALGDPAYRVRLEDSLSATKGGGAGSLTPLPATRQEAESVGTVTLLGEEATEAGLRDALSRRPRWRAVHLACHGLVDTQHPAHSSLAVTAARDGDGFLTALEVFRMQIPADLVVLSACETGKGKVVNGEGIVGLTRAFMFAGSPRVICSLWKVDDEATRALMTKFYELWNPKDGRPGLPTAEALRKAQDFVRAQARWKHPYYWAAWVLWGLPS